MNWVIQRDPDRVSNRFLATFLNAQIWTVWTLGYDIACTCSSYLEIWFKLIF